MPLTQNRPDYTAARLNNIYETIRDGFARLLPRELSGAGTHSNGTAKQRTYKAISDLTMDEAEASAVAAPMDVVRFFKEQMNARCVAYIETETTKTDTFTIYAGRQAVKADVAAPQIFRGKKKGSYAWTESAKRVVVAPQRLVSLVVSVAGTTVGVDDVWSTTAGNNSNNLSIGKVETFTSFIYQPLTRTGQVEYFTDFTPANEIVQTNQPYNVLYTQAKLTVADLSSQCDGAIQTFTTGKYISGTLRVYWNGQRQTTGEQVTEVTTTTFSTTFVPASDDVLLVDYRPDS